MGFLSRKSRKPPEQFKPAPPTPPVLDDVNDVSDLSDVSEVELEQKEEEWRIVDHEEVMLPVEVDASTAVDIDSSACGSTVERLLGDAQAGLRAAAAEWVQTLVDGLSPSLSRVAFSEAASTIIVQLHTPVLGEIATRSRVAVRWEVPESKLLIRAQPPTSPGGDAVLDIDGLFSRAVEGASEIFHELQREWQSQQLDAEELLGDGPYSQFTDFASSWWAHQRSTLVPQSKAWRVIDSLYSATAGQFAPSKDLSEMIVGVSCTTRRRISQLRYFYFGSPPVVQVAASIDPAPEHPEDALKDALVHKIAQARLLSKTSQAIGDKFAPSAMNWTRCFARSRELGLGGANAERLRRLFAAGKAPAGASQADRWFKGALAWQMTDMTYKLSGPHEGRIIWHRHPQPSAV